MPTARERYEAKTKVVTFRVNEELYNDLKKTMMDSGLSFADLIKLGAGIAQQEIEAKIAEKNDLQGKLEQLREAVQTQKQLAAETVAKEREAQHEKLEHEIEIFRLFDLGWGIEEVMFKTEKGRKEVSSYFNEWAEIRGEKEKIQEELLKKCLRRHIAVLTEQISRYATKGALEEANIQLERCRYLLMDPSLVIDQERIFLLSEYSYSL
jgi:regulator of replication initiation timing